MEYKVRVIGEADLKLLYDTLTQEQKESFIAEEIRKGWDVAGVLSLFSEDEIEDWLKKAKGEFLDAFIYKFNLYNSTPDENRENKLSFEDLMRLKMIADGIESSPYAKMIGHGNR